MRRAGRYLVVLFALVGVADLAIALRAYLPEFRQQLEDAWDSKQEGGPAFLPPV